MTADYLADPAELAVWLGRPATDEKLLQALGAASDRFRGAVRHPISHVTGDVITLDGGGRRSLLLPAKPVTAITSVTLLGEALVEGEDYEWSADGYLRRMYCPWPDRLRCVQVTYSHGYTAIPADIAEVVIDQARSQYEVRPGVQTLQAGGESVTFGAQAAVGVTSQWSAMVDKYGLRPSEDA